MVTLEKLLPYNNFVIAYSGGMDSHVLLHSMVELAKNSAIKLLAVHVNHGLSENADAWANHCVNICKQLNVECFVKHIDVYAGLKKKISLEALARKLRYMEFAKLLTKDQCLLTAHHADDQVETVFLQLFRGAGVRGLAAMPVKKKFAESFLLRPLLDFTRNDLRQYAIHNKLNWIEDESNENIGFDRNYIRHKLIPAISNRWPAAPKTILRAANNCWETVELLDILAAQDYHKVLGSKLRTLSVTKLNSLTLVRQRNVLRYWLRRLNLPIPSKVKLHEIQQNILNCSKNANPLVHWREAEIRRYRDDLHAMHPLPNYDLNIIIPWNGEAALHLPHNLGILLPELLTQYKIDPKTSHITIRFRDSAVKKNRLKKIFQENDIPPWLRDRVPILYVDQKVKKVLAHIFI